MHWTFPDWDTGILTSDRPVLHWPMFPKRFGDIYMSPASCPAVWPLELVLGFELHLPLPIQGGDSHSCASNRPGDRICSVTSQGVGTQGDLLFELHQGDLHSAACSPDLQRRINRQCLWPTVSHPRGEPAFLSRGTAYLPTGATRQVTKGKDGFPWSLLSPCQSQCHLPTERFTFMVYSVWFRIKWSFFYHTDKSLFCRIV